MQKYTQPFQQALPQGGGQDRMCHLPSPSDGPDPWTWSSITALRAAPCAAIPAACAQHPGDMAPCVLAWLLWDLAEIQQEGCERNRKEEWVKLVCQQTSYLRRLFLFLSFSVPVFYSQRSTMCNIYIHVYGNIRFGYENMGCMSLWTMLPF